MFSYDVISSVTNEVNFWSKCNTLRMNLIHENIYLLLLKFEHETYLHIIFLPYCVHNLFCSISFELCSSCWGKSNTKPSISIANLEFGCKCINVYCLKETAARTNVWHCSSHIIGDRHQLHGHECGTKQKPNFKFCPNCGQKV